MAPWGCVSTHQSIQLKNDAAQPKDKLTGIVEVNDTHVGILWGVN
jgi:hypothetical protein